MDGGAVRARSLVIELLPAAILLFSMFLKVVSFNLPPGEELGNDWVGWRLADAARAAVGSLGTLLIVAAPLLLLRAVPRLVALWLLNVTVTLIVFADLLHFRYFGDVVSVSAASGWWQVVLVRRSLLELVHPTDVLLVADLVVAAVLIRRYRRFANATAPPSRRRLRGAATAALAAGLALTAIPVIATARDPVGVLGWFRYYGVRRIGLLNYHVYDAGWQISHDLLGMRKVDAADRRRVHDYLAGWRRTALAQSDLFGAAHGRNVIIVMVESLHAFPLNLRIEGAEVTPNLNALARRSLTFENFYSQAWDGHSSDGEFTSLQSLHPLRAGSVPMTYPTHHYRGLPRVLRERGYATLSAHAYYGELWKMREMHPRLGFERSFFRESYQMTEEIGMGLSDREFLRQTVPRLEELDRPFLAFLMTLSTHHPYELPEREVQLPLPFLLEDTVLGRYLRAVHYVDSALGEFVQRLEADGLLDDSVLVVYGDHTTNLGLGDDFFLTTLLERYAGLSPPTEDFDARYWRARSTLPLLIRLPNDRAAGIRSVSAGHVDVAPTLLNLLGIEDHEMVMLGRDLTQNRHSLVVFRDGSFVEGQAYCRPSEIPDRRPRCWSVTSGDRLDPGPFAARLAEAGTHLEVSDLVVEGDLIPRR